MNIEEFLISLGFDVLQNRGFQYWKEAIYYCENKKVFKMEDIYKYIAKKYNSRRDAVEMTMRRSIANINYDILLKDNISKKTKTNKGVLTLIINSQRKKNKEKKLDNYVSKDEIQALIDGAGGYKYIEIRALEKLLKKE